MRQARAGLTRVRRGLVVFRRPRLGTAAVLMQLGAWALQLLSCYVLMVALGLDTRGGPNCTADMAPRTYIIRTPTGIDSSGQVTLLFGETTVALPPL